MTVRDSQRKPKLKTKQPFNAPNLAPTVPAMRSTQQLQYCKYNMTELIRRVEKEK